MAKTDASPTTREITPVDDVRRIREQFDREAGGDIRLHGEQTRIATEKWIKKLGLKFAPPPDPALRAKLKRMARRHR